MWKLWKLFDHQVEQPLLSLLIWKSANLDKNKFFSHENGKDGCGLSLHSWFHPNRWPNILESATLAASPTSDSETPNKRRMSARHFLLEPHPISERMLFPPRVESQYWRSEMKIITISNISLAILNLRLSKFKFFSKSDLK